MIKLTDLTLEERETIMYMSGDDRGVWKIYCDDLVMIERFMKLGLQVTEERKGGGKCFLVPANQVTIRRKRVLSEEERERRRQRAKKNFGHGREEDEVREEELYVEEED
jgi:hypothetical protein